MNKRVFQLTVEPLYNAIQGTDKKPRYIESYFGDFLIGGTKIFSRNKEVRVI